MPSPSTNRPLDSYPRPNVAVDTAVLTVHNHELCVVLTGAHGARRLPGTFLHPGEFLRDAVQRSLEEKAGIHGLRPTQLRVFDDPKRDSRGWVLSVAHAVVVPAVRIESGRGSLAPVRDLPAMPFGHNEIVELAVAQLRTTYDKAADPSHFLGETFTLRDLQRMHEVIAGRELLRETFRKRMAKRVTPTGELMRGVVGKPPQMFRRRVVAD